MTYQSRSLFFPMQKSSAGDHASIPGRLEGNRSSGRFKMPRQPRRQSTPVVYSRLLENGAEGKNTELTELDGPDLTPATGPKQFLKNHQSFSLSACEIILARGLPHRAASRSSCSRMEMSFGSEGGATLRISCMYRSYFHLHWYCIKRNHHS